MTLIAPDRMPPLHAVPDVAMQARGAVDALLATVDVRLRRQVRIAPDPAETIALDRNALSVVYVIEGAVHTRCGDKPMSLAHGDAMLTPGRLPMSLKTDPGTRILVSTLILAPAAAHVADALPDIALVRDFAHHEPAAAALAAQVGLDLTALPLDTAALEDASRDGDAVICRMMANTVLASVIRAWAAHGCAPAGWPARTSDPFLERVIEAIHAAPGRDWSVEGMASVGAMSRTVFAERFRAAFGTSPASYVTEVRIRAAQDRLALGCLVSEISRDLGYSSDEGFSRAFRRRTGQTPSAWREARTA
ncbi:helix-turn-helix transcriptional regulator [Microbacterium azadirachtae]|uniref:HTH-type transcriptional activator RhaR n=1 Tax=Microbacterium azadirachtae TaxID=582680 RepID=A0A0F0LMS4_9MICO|nr:AraC family transcriptional regulator [Microbacterium azadirachtae]KJL34527.1 HTH-type transcriptional activator RhaR [Microbacterium azadirachtae]